eukprot:4622757-Pyramimonas_sp.AAC.1
MKIRAPYCTSRAWRICRWQELVRAPEKHLLGLAGMFGHAARGHLNRCDLHGNACAAPGASAVHQ